MTKHVLISGGTRGLGAALSKRFAQAGYHVTALYLSDAEHARTVSSPHITCVKHDISVTPYMMPTLDKHDELVIIHNATAPFSPKPMHLCEASEYKKQWEVAVMGAHNLICPSLKSLLQLSRATVVGVLSAAMQENHSPKGFAPYSSAKYALKSFVESLAIEFSSRGLRCFSVAPDFMETPLTQGWPEMLRQTIAQEKTILSVDDVAEKIFTLVTSQEIPAKGENYLLEHRP